MAIDQKLPSAHLGEVRDVFRRLDNLGSATLKIVSITCFKIRRASDPTFPALIIDRFFLPQRWASRTTKMVAHSQIQERKMQSVLEDRQIRTGLRISSKQWDANLPKTRSAFCSLGILAVCYHFCCTGGQSLGAEKTCRLSGGSWVRGPRIEAKLIAYNLEVALAKDLSSLRKYVTYSPNGLTAIFWSGSPSTMRSLTRSAARFTTRN